MSKTIRFRFRKGPEVRFLSHLDLLRTMERAIRRAGLPIAYSEGFNPRPKMSFGFALAVGILSEGEYGDYEFVEAMDPVEFQELYNGNLPQGLEVLAARSLPTGTPTLMRLINAGAYDVVIPNKSRGEILQRWEWLQSQDTFMVERETKKGTRQLNIRPFLFDLTSVQEIEQGVAVSCLCALGNEANLRMEELGRLLEFDHLDALITRTGQLIRHGSEYYPPWGIEG